jgi:N-glycosylase/DNA lyase
MIIPKEEGGVSMLQIISKPAVLILPDTERLSLAQTLNCGQSFRWNLQNDNTWVGVIGKRVLWVKEEKKKIFAGCLSRPEMEGEIEPFLREYFDLDTDYQMIQGICGSHPILKKAAAFAGGIHILRQEPWEALCTFILSQNNNIKRIAGLVERLCENFGESILTIDGKKFFSFPTAKALASQSEETLAPVRCGFRAKYVLDAARRISSGEIDLNYLRKIPTQEAMEILMGIKGVGPKVAQCALLFGMHKLDCLPRDVWIGRAMDNLFPEGFPQEVLPIAGVAQQYLFHYVRCHPEILEVPENKNVHI